MPDSLSDIDLGDYGGHADGCLGADADRDFCEPVEGNGWSHPGDVWLDAARELLAGAELETPEGATTGLTPAPCQLIRLAWALREAETGHDVAAQLRDKIGEGEEDDP